MPVPGVSGSSTPLRRTLAPAPSVQNTSSANGSAEADTGHARKSDAYDAHAIVMVALRTRGLRQLQTRTPSECRRPNHRVPCGGVS